MPATDPNSDGGTTRNLGGSGDCPALTIPPEITAQIFAHCLPDSISPPEIDSVPLLLGRICSEWRKIAWASPELWTSLKVDRSDIPVAFIETWLSRAQTLPLSLALEISSIGGNMWDSTPVIAVFKRHSLTWRDVTLEVPLEQLELFGPDLSLPLLERLAIWTDALITFGGAPLTTFRNASALRRLNLGTAVDPRLLQLPWSQIASLESRSGALLPEEFIIILQHTPNITNCAITIYSESELDRLPNVAPLMSLTSLRMETNIPAVLDMFEIVSMPALQVLDLSSILFSGRALVPLMHRFLSKPDCQLRQLSIRIDGDKPREEDFIQLLEAQPTLEKFNIVEGSLGLLIAICRRLSDGSPFLPRLSSLTASPHIYPAAEITSTFPVMLNAVAEALSARWAALGESCARIGECTLSWSGAITDDLDNIVAAFRPRQDELVALGINMAVGED
ncbi:hypothetical protein B0H19DRAFT_1371139 [Mycena capillaripes]|nr:hypothetical protein B0H19DRAFT_1371139 [Mycena capillaripes]